MESAAHESVLSSHPRVLILGQSACDGVVSPDAFVGTGTARAGCIRGPG